MDYVCIHVVFEETGVDSSKISRTKAKKYMEPEIVVLDFGPLK